MAPKSLKDKRIAIIGFGSAGAVAAKELREVEPNCRITIFERRALPGGIWNYDPNPDDSKLKFNSSGQAFLTTDSSRSFPVAPMYEGLRTNITSDLMTYRDSPFEDGTELFPSRGIVNDYLQRWTEKENLNGLVRFNTKVKEIKRIQADEASTNGEGSLWQVHSEDIMTGIQSEEEYDYIVAASGRCNDPFIPLIPGLWNFEGERFHSATYRYPLSFRNKNILVLGNASSGMDIAREANGKVVREFSRSLEWIQDALKSKTGVKVRQSIRDVTKAPGLDYDPKDENSPEWSRNIEVVPQTVKIEKSQPQDKSRIILEDGTILTDVDVIVFGTGYLYSFPFIDHRLEPFKTFPLISSSTTSNSNPDPSLAEFLKKNQDGKPFELELGRRVAPAMSNLDDWQLFHRTEKSFVVLGVPTRIIPFPMAQAQARYAASFWNNQARPLPALDDELLPSDALRWTSPVSSSAPPTPSDTPISHAFGSPSDQTYVDALYSFINDPEAGKAPEWDVTMEDAFENEGYEKGATAPRGNEGLWSTPIWRLLRRQNGTSLRRESLGY